MLMFGTPQDTLANVLGKYAVRVSPYNEPIDGGELLTYQVYCGNVYISHLYRTRKLFQVVFAMERAGSCKKRE